MNILLVSLWPISDTSIGGTERFVLDLANLLSKSCSVTVLSLGHISLNIKNVNTFSLNVVDQLNEYSLSKYLENGGYSEIELKVKSFIKSNKFDIVHCNSLLFANLTNGIPVIHTVHTNQEEFYASFPANIVDMILKNIEQDNNTVYVTPSAYGKESFRAMTKKTPLVITHGFRPDIALRDKISSRQKYGVSGSDIVFCVPSRLEIQQKGQEMLLRALRKVKHMLPSFTVVLSGCDEPYLKNKDYLHKRYPDLSILIERFSDKSDIYSLSDVIILPSKTESFGYAALESAMIGLPLFLSDIPPYREIAKDNRRILLFKSNEIDLAEILIENYNIILAHKIISPPKKWKDKYSEDAMLQKYILLYDECVSNLNINLNV